MLAIQQIADGRTDLVFEYIASGGDAGACDANGTSLLKWCAYYGDVSAIRFLLSCGVSLAALGENLELGGAAFHGHWRLCQFLIENGADVNHPLSPSGETPLHSATSKAGQPEYDHVVNVLLANGADPTRTTVAGAETGSFMRDCRTRGETPLHRAAAFGSQRMIQMLTQAGGRLDSKDANGDTPLTWASWHLRPAPILRVLCYGEYSIHPDADWAGDHGAGCGGMKTHLLGKPHVDQ